MDEIASRAGVSHRAAQAARAVLTRSGQLDYRENRSPGSRFSAASTWRLTGGPPGAKNRGPKEKTSSSGFTTEEKSGAPRTEPASPALRRKQGEGCALPNPPARSPGQAGDGAGDSPASAPLAEQIDETPTEAEARLALDALAQVDPDAADAARSSTAALIDALDRLRRQRAAHLFPVLWAAGRARHGFRAHLAVLESVTLAEAGTVRDVAAYTAGILRRPSDECRPDVTLTRFAAWRRAQARRAA
ncbi:MAG: hypothetical protein HQL40_03235 [Alphaproteobacteria bacterium]|nr:hypothetical protein [Alphaproteobacteria bacterium]MBF0372158.1 hypothetical protein [Alphaproteobacteria bacterium]